MGERAVEGLEDTAGRVDSMTGARRRVVLVSIILSALIVSLDTTVMSVAIPTVLEEFHTTLSSLQWVLTGYSLVFASLLVIGGRLGDLHGHRRMFAIGGSLFAVGSFVAMVSWSVPSLFMGEALIEGVGACLMLPSAMAMISNSFHGRDRATAFSMLGVAIGVGVALGPLLGGFFTSQLTWRLAFGLNVVIAPCAVLGVLLFLPRSEKGTARPRLDLTGSLLLSTGMLALVFALSEGGTFGWWEPQEPFTIAGARVWPDSLAISVVPAAVAVAVVLLTTFVVVETRKERAARDPLIEFSGLRHRRFRYGLLTTGILSMGQLGLMIVLSVVLQSAARLSAVEVGVWLVPFGAAIVVGARVGAVSTNRFDGVVAVRMGIAIQLVGLVWIIAVMAADVTFWELAPGLVFYGLGIGTASAQLTNLILSDVDRARSGVASGTTSTVRQVAAALGIATVSTILTEQSLDHALANIRAAGLSPSLRDRAVGALERLGTSFEPPLGTSPPEAATLLRALADGVAAAARPALSFGLVLTMVGFTVSFLMPRPEVG